MANVIQNWPARTGGNANLGGWNAKYPWDEWLDGRIWRLVQGEDFDPDVDQFRVYVKQVGYKRNKKVATMIERNESGADVLFIQCRNAGEIEHQLEVGYPMKEAARHERRPPVPSLRDSAPV